MVFYPISIVISTKRSKTWWQCGIRRSYQLWPNCVWVEVTESFTVDFCGSQVGSLHSTFEIPPITISELSVWLFPHREESITTAFQKHHKSDTHRSKYQIPITLTISCLRSCTNKANRLMVSTCEHSSETCAVRFAGSCECWRPPGSGSGWAIQYRVRSLRGQFHACLR